MSPETKESDRTYGHWLVAFIDLLGQKDAFLKTDVLPESDPAKETAFNAAVQQSVGAIRLLRGLLDDFRLGQRTFPSGPRSPFHGAAPEVRETLADIQTRRVRQYRWSDGVVLACPLRPGPGHAVPIYAVDEILGTCAVLMLLQLVAGHPIRGGLDVGTAVEVDGELFGAALVKAYELESKCAGHPRLVVGQQLVSYLNQRSSAKGDDPARRFERGFAEACRSVIAEDVDADGAWILDYAGPHARRIFFNLENTVVASTFHAALAFARRSRDEFREIGNAKLRDRYSKVVRYLEERASFWGAID